MTKTDRRKPRDRASLSDARWFGRHPDRLHRFRYATRNEAWGFNPYRLAAEGKIIGVFVRKITSRAFDRRFLEIDASTARLFVATEKHVEGSLRRIFDTVEDCGGPFADARAVLAPEEVMRT